MDIIELAKEIGLVPLRVSSTNGGEFACACPACKEGIDRFRLWPNSVNGKGVKGRYWCRRCGQKGDLIQFCRDFLGLGYPEACQKLHISTFNKHMSDRRKSDIFNPTDVAQPPPMWQEKAGIFVKNCQETILRHPQLLEDLKKNRGLNFETIFHYQIGWNAKEEFLPWTEWGLDKEKDPMGKPRCLYFPKGIVIPTFIAERVSRIKIRQDDWNPQLSSPKYREVAGSSQAMTVLDYKTDLPVLLVEAELDAMLVCQEAKGLCSCLALGGATKKPDENVHKVLMAAPLILFSLDFDETGKGAYYFWKKTYPNLVAWPICDEKSPGDAFRKGIDLKQWIEVGLKNYKFKGFYE